MKRLNWEDIQANVPKDYTDATTKGKLMDGLNRVAPPGKEADPDTAELYEKHTDEAAGKRMVENWGNSRLFRSSRGR